MLGEDSLFEETEKLVQVARDIAGGIMNDTIYRGYPDGLKGEEIPISAQVVSLADVYDALVSVRVYKAAMRMKKQCR